MEEVPCLHSHQALVPARPSEPSLDVCVCISHSVLSDSVILWTEAHQAPLSMGFSRQEYWSG